MILAAGTSSRAGTVNKLLYPYKGKPLVLHVVHTLAASRVDSVLIVSGHDAQKVEELIADDPLGSLFNENYQQGIGSSLALGISSLYRHDAVIVCLGDMPHVTPNVINALIDALIDTKNQRIEKSFFIPTYGGKRGNPVLIKRNQFDALLKLEGDSGARELINRSAQQVHEVAVQCKGVLEDFDTLEQLNSLSSL